MEQRSQFIGPQWWLGGHIERTACVGSQRCQAKCLTHVEAVHGLEPQLRQPRNDGDELRAQQWAGHPRPSEQASDTTGGGTLEHKARPQADYPQLG